MNEELIDFSELRPRGEPISVESEMTSVEHLEEINKIAETIKN